MVVQTQKKKTQTKVQTKKTQPNLHVDTNQIMLVTRHFNSRRNLEETKNITRKITECNQREYSCRKQLIESHVM